VVEEVPEGWEEIRAPKAQVMEVLELKVPLLQPLSPPHYKSDLSMELTFILQAAAVEACTMTSLEGVPVRVNTVVEMARRQSRPFRAHNQVNRTPVAAAVEEAAPLQT
jgi:hypothetical protein